MSEHMSKKPTTIYRALLRDAWQVTWQRKSLWVFGIFAAFISSGGVVDVAISGLRHVTATGSLLEQLFERSFIGYAYASQFLLQLEKIDPNQFSIMLIMLTFVCVGLLFSGVISQAALIHGSGGDAKHPLIVRRAILKHVWDVLFVDLITKIFSAILIIITTLPVLLYLVQPDPFFSQLLFIHFLIFIPAIILIHILSMLALNAVVEEGVHALAGIHRALSLFKTHWLSSIEFGFILFLTVFGSGILFAMFLSLLSIPYRLIFSTALFSGSMTLFFGGHILMLILLGILLFIFGGIIVTFQYTAWHLFYQRASHRIHGLKPFSKIWRSLFA